MAGAAGRAVVAVVVVAAIAGGIALLGRGRDVALGTGDEAAEAAASGDTTRPGDATAPTEGRPADAPASVDASGPEAGLPTPDALAQGPQVPSPSPEDLPARQGRPAAEVAVQVLDGTGDPALADAAVAALEGLGYVVVARNPVSQAAERTTVLVTEGNDAEAADLIAADPRFGAPAPNERWSPAVALHVLVGADWPR